MWQSFIGWCKIYVLHPILTKFGLYIYIYIYIYIYLFIYLFILLSKINNLSLMLHLLILYLPKEYDPKMGSTQS